MLPTSILRKLFNFLIRCDDVTTIDKKNSPITGAPRDSSHSDGEEQPKQPANVFLHIRTGLKQALGKQDLYFNGK